jgi:antitoxin PrlF
LATLTITAKGQVTLRRELLRHLGVQPGEQIEVSTLPGGWIEVRAAQPSGSFEAFIGRLAGRTAKVASLDEISAAIRALMEAGNVNLDRAAVEAWLWQMEAGGDTFLSFDRRAVALLQQRGIAAALQA